MGKGKRLRYIARQMIRRYFSDSVAQSAAELAYFLLFSFFPILMFLNSVLARIDIPAQAVQTVLAFLPVSLRDMITGYLRYIGSVPSISPMIIGIILSLYFVSRAMRSLLRTVNRLYRVELRAGSVRQTLSALSLTAGFLGAIVASLLLVVIGRWIVHFLERFIVVPSLLTRLAGSSGYLLTAVFVFVFLMLLNRAVPNVRLTWRDAVPGALFSLVAWVVITMGFSFYVDNMARYSVLYGSLGAMMVLMLWLYLTGIVMILGAQLNHIIWSLHQAERGL